MGIPALCRILSVTEWEYQLYIWILSVLYWEYQLYEGILSVFEWELNVFCLS